MARFFVSYSRSVKDEVAKVVELLRASGHKVWWDGDIPIMADWWATILKHIEWCEVVIFVASEKSVESPYCLAELKYGNDRQRPIIPFIMGDPKTYSLPPELPSRAQWLLYDGDATEMLGKINEAYQFIDWALHQDMESPRPPEPMTGGKSVVQQFQEARRQADALNFDDAKRLLRGIRNLDFGNWGAECDEWLRRITSYIHVMDLAAGDATRERAIANWNSHVQKYTDKFDPTHLRDRLHQVSTVEADRAKAEQLAREKADAEALAQEEREAKRLAHEKAITEALEQKQREAARLAREKVAAQALEKERLAREKATAEALEQERLESARLAREKVAAEALEQERSHPIASDVAAPTLEPRQTSPLSLPVVGVAVIAVIIVAWVVFSNRNQASRMATEEIIQSAHTAVLANSDWIPTEQEFDGVMMLLVPVGCFEMGSNTGNSNEKPVHTQCIESPFWLDKTEVTQAQFVANGGVKANANGFTGDNRPVEQITWFEAREYCARRGGRLPTEAEWEYAARGPDGLAYPWGDVFVADNVVYNRTTSQGTADVGSKPAGV